jgi:dGTPase
MPYNQEIIDFAKEKQNLIQNFTDQEHEEDNDQRNDSNRDRYRRDYARVLYSSSFRRLQGKMQLLGINPTNFHRNRLTHSLEVAQIAGSIARYLELEDPVVVETCSLAHDLGNPPFGHAGEEVLNSLALDIGGYEGNAQTFRILRHLEKKHFEYAGLNLTLRTLLGVTKYFYRKGENPKKPGKFLYEEDYLFLGKKAQKKNFIDKKSIDAQIMDLSDEIAYAAHDLEDAISFGFMTVGEIIYEFKNSEEFKGASDIFDEIAKDSQAFATQANRMDTSEEYSFLLRKELTSNIVYKLITHIGVVSEDEVKQLGYTGNYGKLAEGLKKLVFKALLRKKDVQLYEKQGERIIRGLFEVYTDPRFNDKFLLLPPEYRAIAKQVERKTQQETITKKRVVIDYIAGMMDSFAIQEYQRYFGASSLEKIYEKNV